MTDLDSGLILQNISAGHRQEHFKKVIDGTPKVDDVPEVMGLEEEFMNLEISKTAQDAMVENLKAAKSAALACEDMDEDDRKVVTKSLSQAIFNQVMIDAKYKTTSALLKALQDRLASLKTAGTEQTA